MSLENDYARAKTIAMNLPGPILACKTGSNIPLASAMSDELLEEYGEEIYEGGGGFYEGSMNSTEDLISSMMSGSFPSTASSYAPTNGINPTYPAGATYPTPTTPTVPYKPTTVTHLSSDPDDPDIHPSPRDLDLGEITPYLSPDLGDSTIYPSSGDLDLGTMVYCLSRDILSGYLNPVAKNLGFGMRITNVAGDPTTTAIVPVANKLGVGTELANIGLDPDDATIVPVANDLNTGVTLPSVSDSDLLSFVIPPNTSRNLGISISFNPEETGIAYNPLSILLCPQPQNLGSFQCTKPTSVARNQPDVKLLPKNKPINVSLKAWKLPSKDDEHYYDQMHYFDENFNPEGEPVFITFPHVGFYGKKLVKMDAMRKFCEGEDPQELIGKVNYLVDKGEELQTQQIFEFLSYLDLNVEDFSNLKIPDSLADFLESAKSKHFEFTLKGNVPTKKVKSYLLFHDFRKVDEEHSEARFRYYDKVPVVDGLVPNDLQHEGIDGLMGFSEQTGYNPVQILKSVFNNTKEQLGWTIEIKPVHAVSKKRKVDSDGTPKDWLMDGEPIPKEYLATLLHPLTPEEKNKSRKVKEILRTTYKMLIDELLDKAQKV